MTSENKLTNGNDYAYPMAMQDEKYHVSDYSGLTKREYFAGLVMQGLSAKYNTFEYGIENTIAEQSIKIADALIAELNRRKQI